MLALIPLVTSCTWTGECLHRSGSRQFKRLVASAIHRRAAQLVASSPNAVTPVTRDKLAAVEATDWNRGHAQWEVAFRLAHESLKRDEAEGAKEFSRTGGMR